MLFFYQYPQPVLQVTIISESSRSSRFLIHIKNYV